MPRKTSALEAENKSFAKRLSEIMGETGTTQEALAKSLEVRRQTVALYKSGQSSPDTEKLALIVKHFESIGSAVTADWLLGLTKDRSRMPSAVDELGLSENAVSALLFIGKNGDSFSQLDTLNGLLSQPLFLKLLAIIPQYCAARHREDGRQSLFDILHDKNLSPEEWSQFSQKQRDLVDFIDNILSGTRTTKHDILMGADLLDYLEYNLQLIFRELVEEFLQERKEAPPCPDEAHKETAPSGSDQTDAGKLDTQ
jgi:Predicted transcriptional regulators